MTGDKGTPSAIHAGMGVINPEAHAANIPGALRAIARRADADEPATEPDFPTLAAQYASMLGLDAPEPVLVTTTPVGRAFPRSSAHHRLGAHS